MATETTSPAPAEGSFDLSYSIHDFTEHEGDYPDGRFLTQRLAKVMTDLGAVAGRRTFDITCGAGGLAQGVRGAGADSWGLDPSAEMLGVSRWLYPSNGVVLLRGVAERLPVQDHSFARVVCKCSLDHFVKPGHFVREAARVLQPDGRLVIALANYESLSCRLGRLRNRISRSLLKRGESGLRHHWEIPSDHLCRGDLRFVRQLGGRWFDLERCFGISLLWGSYRWGPLLTRLPDSLSHKLLSALDWAACRVPSAADIIVSVWKRR